MGGSGWPRMGWPWVFYYSVYVSHKNSGKRRNRKTLKTKSPTKPSAKYQNVKKLNIYTKSIGVYIYKYILIMSRSASAKRK